VPQLQSAPLPVIAIDALPPPAIRESGCQVTAPRNSQLCDVTVDARLHRAAPGPGVADIGVHQCAVVGKRDGRDLQFVRLGGLAATGIHVAPPSLLRSKSKMGANALTLTTKTADWPEFTVALFGYRQ
jgi:hypothetical protein